MIPRQIFSSAWPLLLYCYSIDTRKDEEDSNDEENRNDEEIRNDDKDQQFNLFIHDDEPWQLLRRDLATLVGWTCGFIQVVDSLAHTCLGLANKMRKKTDILLDHGIHHGIKPSAFKLAN